jgi:hypothetical protein
MKKSTLLLLSMLLVIIANAQFKQIAEGPVFKEPVEGYAKILQLKNGNTMFINITTKKSIDVRLYNADHQEIAVTDDELNAVGKLKHSSIEGVFEISGNVVICISEIDSRTPVLYRVIIDGKNGDLKEESKIGELNKLGFGAGYAIIWGNVPLPDFYVRKDPNSDNYAVAMFNSFESERSKRIEIVVYGSDNKEVRRAYYASPQEKYKYLVYLDMAVIGPDKVSVLAYGYNTNHSGGKASELILANLDKGASSVTFTELNFSKDLIVHSGVVRYNPVMKILALVATTKAKEKDKSYVPYFALVDPFKQQLLRADPISPSDKLIEFDKKEKFDGLPQNLFINDDGSTTIVYEEMVVSTYTSSQFGSTTSTGLGRVAVVNYSKTGEPVNEFLARKSQILYSTGLGPFYLSQREGTAQWLFSGNQYKSFAYINGKDKSYLLFNDTERNNDSQEGGKLVTVNGVSGSDGFYYPLAGSAMVPKRDYIFGQPEKKRDHNLALFSISDYDRNNNVYAVLKLENESGKKGVKLVWLQP